MIWMLKSVLMIVDLEFLCILAPNNNIPQEREPPPPPSIHIIIVLDYFM
jgi:hypothetical protein